MKQFIILIFINTILCLSLKAQSDIFALSGTRVSSILDIAPDNKGNLLISGLFKETLTIGSKQFNANNGDSFIGKLDAANNTIWSFQISGAVKEIKCLNDNIFVLGQYVQNLNFNGTTKTSAYTNTFLACLDNNGNTLWLIDGIATGNVFPTKLEVDKDGNCYVLCTFHEGITLESTSLKKAGTKNAYIAKYNSSGKLLWAKHMTGGDSFITGIWPSDLCIDTKNNQILISGNFAGECKFDPFNIKTRKFVFGPGAELWGNEVFIVKYSTDGVCKDVKSVITAANVSQIETDAEGNIYIGGHFKGEVAATKTTNDIGISYFCGNKVKTTIDPDMGPSEEGYIVKMNAQHQMQWIVRHEGRSTDRIIGFSFDDNKNIYTCGFAHIEVGISGKTKKIPIAPVQGTGEELYKGEIIITKIKPDGEPEWLKMCGGKGQDNTYDICLSNNTLKVAGLLSGNVTFENKAYTIGAKYNGVIISLKL
jgi:hypothetical protein